MTNLYCPVRTFPSPQKRSLLPLCCQFFPYSQATTDLFPVPIVLLLIKCHINGLIQYVVFVSDFHSAYWFCNSPMSLHVISSLFLFTFIIPLYRYIPICLSIHKLWASGQFQVFGYHEKAAKKSHIHILGWTCFIFLG